MRLSIIIPAFNEEKTIHQIVERVRSAPIGGMEKEIIVIDDGSSDKTLEIVKSMVGIKAFRHSANQGKGAAVKTGFLHSTGDICVIQDADLEYDPKDYPALLAPILAGEADVVYGSRFITDRPRRVMYFWHFLGNSFLTFFSNMLTNLNLSDMETGYKAFKKYIVEKMAPDLKAKRFGIEPELTARVARMGARVYEVGISYHGRSYEQGKKIGYKDGIAALWHIIRFNIF